MAKDNENSREVLLPEVADRKNVDRRRWLAGSAAAATALFASGRAGAQNMQAVEQKRRDTSASDPGPENTDLRRAQPNTFAPPPTDHGEVETFWNSFSSAHRRIQPGGWSRQVTVRDFPIAKDIAGVNMRLTAGGIRELHWHAAAEWAIMLTGKARITCIDNQGRSFVDDAGVGDLWFFPTGIPHSIQGLAPDGCEFLLVFDDGTFSEGDTTLLSDWTRHTPREVLAKNWGVPESVLGPYMKCRRMATIFSRETYRLLWNKTSKRLQLTRVLRLFRLALGCTPCLRHTRPKEEKCAWWIPEISKYRAVSRQLM